MRRIVVYFLCGLSIGMFLLSCQSTPKSFDEASREHLHQYVLQAPGNIPKWEPSAAVVIDGILWVANDNSLGDRSALAGYDLHALKTWDELRNECADDRDRREGRCDGNMPKKNVFIKGAIKIEAGALLKGQAIWWDTKRENTDVVCTGSEATDCDFIGEPRLLMPSNSGLSYDAVLQKTVKEKMKVGNLQYVTVEGLAVLDEHTWWVGVRKYGVKTPSGKNKEIYWTAIVDQTGENIAWGGRSGELILDHKEFAISDLVLDGDKIWATLSYERPENAEHKFQMSDVEGRLARGTLPANGGKIEMRLCMDKRKSELPEPLPLKLIGKPEAVAVVDSETLVVIYDNDAERKQESEKPNNPNLFPIQQNQDYLEFIKKNDCSLGKPLKTKM